MASVPDKNQNIIDRTGTFKLGSSKPEENQEWFLYSYCLDPKPQNGIYGAIKPIGMFKTEQKAEERLLEELNSDFAKTFKIGKTGTHFLLKDPAALSHHEIDKVVEVENKEDKKKGMRIIAAQNARIKHQEDKDKKEIEEQERQLLDEMKKEQDENRDKYTYDDYCILMRKLVENPAQEANLKHIIENASKEIQILRERHIKNKEELNIFNQKHPEFAERLKNDVELMKKIQRGKTQG